MKYLFLLGLLVYLLAVSGCGTPEGGSSLPWSKPEPWETQTLPSMEE